jgi:hypothetical protein
MKQSIHKSIALVFLIIIFASFSAFGAIDAAVLPSLRTQETQKTLQTLSRDTNNSHKTLGKIFDKKKIDEQQETAKVFGEVANELVGDIAKYNTKKYEDAQLKYEAAKAAYAAANGDTDAQAKAETAMIAAGTEMNANQANYDAWKDGSLNKILLHTIVGGVEASWGGGNAFAGAIGGGTSEASSRLTEDLSKDGQQWASLLLGAAAAKLAGGSTTDAITGGVTALDAERYNRQLHESEIIKIKKLAKDFARDNNISEDEAEGRLMSQALMQTDKGYRETEGMPKSNDQAALEYLQKNSETFTVNGQKYTQFAAQDIKEWRDSGLFSETLKIFAKDYKLGDLARADLQKAVERNSPLKEFIGSTMGVGLGLYEIGKGTAKGTIELAKLGEQMYGDNWQEGQAKIDAAAKQAKDFMSSPLANSNQYLNDQNDKADMLYAQGKYAESTAVSMETSATVLAAFMGLKSAVDTVGGLVVKSTLKLTGPLADAAKIAEKGAALEGNAAKAAWQRPEGLETLQPRNPRVDIGRNEAELIGKDLGLQTKTSSAFENVPTGAPGEKETKYLWTIDERGVNAAREKTPFDTDRGCIVHTNISEKAAAAGEVWFGSDNTVYMNFESGRFGRDYISNVAKQGAVKAWEDLGYNVKVVPPPVKK